MTANALARDRERCLAAGMNDYLSKPVRQEVLASMLHHWLEVAPLAEPDAHPASAVSAGEAAATVDLAVLADLAMLAEDDPIGLLSEIMETYLTDAHRLFEAMQAALDDKDLRALQQSAHSLKSASGYVGAAQLAALCERAEQACREASIPRLAGILFQAGSEFERVQLEFQRYPAASAGAD